jgi:hypothetical protein
VERAACAISTQRGTKDAAIAAYEALLARYPEFTLAQKRLAGIYASSGKTLSKAAALLAEVKKRQPLDPETTQLSIEISYRSGEYTKVVELLRQGNGAAALDAKALYYLGMSQLQLRSTEESRSALSRAIAAGLQEPLLTSAKQALDAMSKAAGDLPAAPL